jgi:hypothetical protein
MEVVVLNCWVTETKDTPWASNSSTSLAKSASDLVKRYSAQQYCCLRTQAFNSIAGRNTIVSRDEWQRYEVDNVGHDPQRLMDTDEIVVHRMKRNRRSVVLNLF